LQWGVYFGEAPPTPHFWRTIVTSVHRAGRRLLVALAAAALLLTIVTVPASGSAEQPPIRQDLPLEEDLVVRILVPGSDVIYELQDAGYDLAGNAQRVPNGFEVDAVVTADQLDALEDFGVVLAGEALPEATAPLSLNAIEAADTDTVVVGRADWFTTKGQGFLSVEAKSSANQSAALVL
jgi:hypothetical protein